MTACEGDDPKPGGRLVRVSARLSLPGQNKARLSEPISLSSVLANRAFLGRAVCYLAAEAGVRQFLDIGTGIPTADNPHQVAQRVAPDSKIVYVDNDPVVLTHARALLTSSPERTTSYLNSDLRNSGAIVENARRRLDFGVPIAVMLVMVLHLIPDSDDPWRMVSRLADAVPAGGYLVVSPGERYASQHPGREEQAPEPADAGHANDVPVPCGGEPVLR